jgi:hypothetical protein
MKKISTLFLVLSLAVFSGCGGSDDVEFGLFLGELGCMTASTDGDLDVSEVDALGVQYGITSDADYEGYLTSSTTEELAGDKVDALAFIAENCDAVFTDQGVDAEIWIDIMLEL